MKHELIIALDIPNADRLPSILDTLPDEVDFFKVGLELFTGDGDLALAILQERNKRIFLDLKLHDIPKTVEKSVRSICKKGVNLITIHAAGGRAMMQAAADAAAETSGIKPEVVAVTTLTSLSEEDFADIGISRKLNEQAKALGQLALEAGIDGVVTSPLELVELRAALGPDAVLVTPGIRPGGKTDDDQKRIATPTFAVTNGSNYLVVGRPILQADDPAAAAKAILAEISAASG
jgi:orotidine-5'-phosphate decarboxylase